MTTMRFYVNAVGTPGDLHTKAGHVPSVTMRAMESHPATAEAIGGGIGTIEFSIVGGDMADLVRAGAEFDVTFTPVAGAKKATSKK